MKAQRRSALERVREVHIERGGVSFSSDEIYVTTRARYRDRTNFVADLFEAEPDPLTIEQIWGLVRGDRTEVRQAVAEEWPRFRAEWEVARRGMITGLVDKLAPSVSRDELIDAHNLGIVRSIQDA